MDAPSLLVASRKIQELIGQKRGITRRTRSNGLEELHFLGGINMEEFNFYPYQEQKITV
jgi:hypothetical protein